MNSLKQPCFIYRNLFGVTRYEIHFKALTRNYESLSQLRLMHWSTRIIAEKYISIIFNQFTVS